MVGLWPALLSLVAAVRDERGSWEERKRIPSSYFSARVLVEDRNSPYSPPKSHRNHCSCNAAALRRFAVSHNISDDLFTICLLLSWWFCIASFNHNLQEKLFPCYFHWDRSILASHLVFLNPMVHALNICHTHQAFSFMLPLSYSALRFPTSAIAHTVFATGPGHRWRMYAATISWPFVIPPTHNLARANVMTI